MDIRKIAEEAFEESSGDYELAKKLLAERMPDNATPILVDIAVADLVRRAAHDKRKKITSLGMNGTSRREVSEFKIPTNASDRINAIVMRRGFYDWPLPGGKKLGDATFSNVRESITSYGLQKSGLERKIKFLASLLERETKAEFVRDAWKEEEIAIIAQKQGEELTDAAA